MCTHHKGKKWFDKIFTLRYEGWNLTKPASLFSFSENGPKQNAWSILTPVSDTDFSALLCDLEAAFCLHFGLHSSSNNRLFQRFWLVVEELGPIAKRLKSYHGEQNWGYHLKEQEKLDQKQASKVTLHFVWGHL